jgi:hypothetical protein
MTRNGPAILALVSANHLPETLVHLSLQHILDLLWGVAIDALKAQLLASLLTGHELTLNSEPSISNLLPAVVANLLSPYSALPT